MIQISCGMFEFAFKWLESLLNGSNFHSNASNLVWMVRIWFPMARKLEICLWFLWISFEWFESRSNSFWIVRACHSNTSKDSNHLKPNLNASNLVRMVQIWFRMVGILFKTWNMLSNASNLVKICNRMVKIPFQWFKFELICFESRSNDLNLVSNG